MFFASEARWLRFDLNGMTIVCSGRGVSSDDDV